jgi:hypothetical protein
LNAGKVGADNPARPNKIVGAAEAVRLIHDGDPVTTGCFVGIGSAEGIAVARESASSPPPPRPGPARRASSPWSTPPGRATAGIAG